VTSDWQPANARGKRTDAKETLMTENKHTFAGQMDRDNTEALNPTSTTVR
jgi:hypothetical protein